ncbi:unnamed protein product [Nippostrongylus brasiliensis]|nr:unnamed protein product [Nippostrongylus brasiliensis]
MMIQLIGIKQHHDSDNGESKSSTVVKPTTKHQMVSMLDMSLQ